MYVLDNTWPCSPARHSSYTKHVLTYMVSVGSIPNKDASAPSPFLSYLGMLFIYAFNRSAYLPGGCGCVYLVPVGVWVNPQPAAGKQGELAQGPILLQVLRRIHKSGKSYNPYCKCPLRLCATFFFTNYNQTGAFIYFLFVGENTPGTDDKKCAKQFKGKPTEKPTRQKPVPSHKAREKGAQ